MERARRSFDEVGHEVHTCRRGFTPMPLADGVGHGFEEGLRLTVRDHVAGDESLEGRVQGHGESGCERSNYLDSRDLGFLVHALPHQMPIAEVEHPGAVATYGSRNGP